jgi:hypothetical protein
MNNIQLDTNKIASTLPKTYSDLKSNTSYLYFNPDLTQIKDSDSKQCFTRGENSENQKSPMIQIQGLHSKESCRLNAASYLADMKWRNNFVPNSDIKSSSSTVNIKENKETKTPGLDYKVITGYFNDDVYLFNSATVLKKGR